MLKDKTLSKIRGISTVSKNFSFLDIALYRFQ